MRILRPIVAALLLSASAAAALAAARSPQGDYAPDPGLRTAGKAELESRVRRACINTHARLQNASEASMGRPCGCYASRVMRGLDAGELDAYRSTGVFNDSAREKALAAIDRCKLQRPI
jgi:curli biogenesis system outer membrane secretion channel CsgG